MPKPELTLVITLPSLAAVEVIMEAVAETWRTHENGEGASTNDCAADIVRRFGSIYLDADS